MEQNKSAVIDKDKDKKVILNKEVIFYKKAILDQTHYGLKVYAHVLRKYYTDAVVLTLRGKRCRLAKNPFNGDRYTLQVFLVENLAVHYDTELEHFRGDVFDFASLHYKLEGEELLHKLNEELNLGIGNKVPYCNRAEAVNHAAANGDQSSTGSSQSPQSPQSPQSSQRSQVLISAFSHISHNPQNPYKLKNNKSRIARAPKFSYFRKPVQNTTSLGYCSLVDICMMVQSTTFKAATEKLRALNDKEKARKYKEKNFDYVTFSGIFTTRENDALVRHSGLFAVDLDHVQDVEGLKQKLLQDPYFETELLFVSPSGNGLKWIIPIDLKKTTHQEWARSLGIYLLKAYGQKIDPSGKDVSRACFLPHDPNIYINPKYTI